MAWSDWFSIYHPVKGWRAYRYWETTDPVPVTETVEGVDTAFAALSTEERGASQLYTINLTTGIANAFIEMSVIPASTSC